jgi:hypothetical protein
MNKTQKLALVLSGAALLAPVLAFAEMPAGMGAAINTAVQDLTSDVSTAFTTNLPLVLGLAAGFIVIMIVWKFFKKIVGK